MTSSFQLSMSKLRIPMHDQLASSHDAAAHCQLLIANALSIANRTLKITVRRDT